MLIQIGNPTILHGFDDDVVVLQRPQHATLEQEVYLLQSFSLAGLRSNLHADVEIEYPRPTVILALGEHVITLEGFQLRPAVLPGNGDGVLVAGKLSPQHHELASRTG